MKIWVTNESSSFARSFADWCRVTGKHQFVNSLENDEYDYFRQDNYFRSKEIDIFDPTLPTMISRSDAELIIHQLPITPDRSVTHPDYALRNNIEGSFYVMQAAKEIGIPIFFITTKNYNNEVDNSIYNITAGTVERLLDSFNVEHVTVVPPNIYGPQFDEGISGLIKTALNKKESVQLNIDPEIQHAYMYVDDFFDALDIAINKSFDGEYDVINQSVVEILPSLDKYVYLDDIFQILEEDNYCLSYEIKPEGDRLEEQNMDDNISTLYGWNEKFNIKTGIIDFISKVKDE